MHASDQVHEGRLAGAVASKQSEDLILLHGQVHILQGAAFAKVLPDVLQHDRILRCTILVPILL